MCVCMPMCCCRILSNLNLSLYILKLILLYFLHRISRRQFSSHRFYLCWKTKKKNDKKHTNDNKNVRSARNDNHIGNKWPVGKLNCGISIYENLGYGTFYKNTKPRIFPKISMCFEWNSHSIFRTGRRNAFHHSYIWSSRYSKKYRIAEILLFKNYLVDCNACEVISLGFALWNIIK